MARILIAFSALLVALACLFAYFSRVPTPEDVSGFDIGAPTWQPGPDEVYKQAKVNGTDPATAEGRAARIRFTNLFKSRYRLHTPEMAVGLNFEGDGPLELKLPARMEPWNMDRLAMTTYNETRKAFGHPFDIDLFITYIGAPPLKIGWLRTNSATNKFEITHLRAPLRPESMQPGHRFKRFSGQKNAPSPIGGPQPVNAAIGVQPKSTTGGI